MQRPRQSSVGELMTINLPLSVCSAQHSNGLDTDQLLLLFAHCTTARLNAAALLPMLKDRTTQASHISCFTNPRESNRRFFDRYFHIPLPIVTKHELGLPFPLGTFP